MKGEAATPPRAPEWRSWTYVVAWTLVLLATLPLAGWLQQSIERYAGKWVYVALVGFLVALFAGVSARYVIRTQHIKNSNVLWIAGPAMIVVGITATSRTPIEGIHFIQFGVLGLLAFRALSHRMRDLGVYLSATLIATMVGTVDEAIQWMLPDRVFDHRDILFNLSGALLVQVAIGLGFRPAYIAARMGYASIRKLCWQATAATMLVGATFFNTPQQIDWYTARSPLLAGLFADANVMAEYGFVHDVPRIGRFRSRFSLDELRKIDKQIGIRVGPQLEQLRETGGYRQFLREHSARRDPVAHEAAVHLATRNHHQKLATRTNEPRDVERRSMTIAYRENQILELYFPTILANSTFQWREDQKRTIATQANLNAPFFSTVSKELITSLDDRSVLMLFAGLTLALVVAGTFIPRRP